MPKRNILKNLTQEQEKTVNVNDEKENFNENINL